MKKNLIGTLIVVLMVVLIECAAYFLFINVEKDYDKTKAKKLVDKYFTDNYVVIGNIFKDGTDVIQTIKYEGKIGGNGLVNWNNPDYINIEKCCKEYKGLTEQFRYNPIPLKEKERQRLLRRMQEMENFLK